ncbi:MAG TPA: hypothetical protein DDY78_29775 [Planctomycetales bacterium]|jgi:hypothetical protein|nr:hypothetical protein [Planctomycetales bacterium]
MAICSDGKTVVVRYNGAPLKSYDEDTSHLKFFDLATGKERPDSTRLDRVWDFALSPDGAKMATLHKLSAVGKELMVKVGDLPASVQKK